MKNVSNLVYQMTTDNGRLTVHLKNDKRLIPTTVSAAASTNNLVSDYDSGDGENPRIKSKFGTNIGPEPGPRRINPTDALCSRYLPLPQTRIAK